MAEFIRKGFISPVRNGELESVGKAEHLRVEYLCKYDKSSDATALWFDFMFQSCFR